MKRSAFDGEPVQAENQQESPNRGESIALRPPEVRDAAAIFELVRKSKVLDPNSLYCYLLMCRDFSATCVVAEQNSQLVGFVTAYRPPDQPESLFVWQVAVDPSARRQGLGNRLLDHLMSRPSCSGVRYLEATVAPSNVASRRLFDRFAATHDVAIKSLPGFAVEDFGTEDHESEPLLRLGPFSNHSTEKHRSC